MLNPENLTLRRLLVQNGYLPESKERTFSVDARLLVQERLLVQGRASWDSAQKNGVALSANSSRIHRRLLSLAAKAPWAHRKENNESAQNRFRPSSTEGCRSRYSWRGCHNLDLDIARPRWDRRDP